MIASVATPPANPTDVVSIDAIIAAVYDVISGPAGKKRNWDRLRSLFIPGARLIPTNPRQTGGYGSRALGVDDYIARAEPFFEKEGFYEKGLHGSWKRLARLRTFSVLTNPATH